MKKFLFLMMASGSLLVKAQSFHRGAVVLDVNAGAEAFNTVQRYQRVTGASDTIVTSEAGNKNASAGLEIGLGKRIGIGARGKLNTFFKDLDAVTRQKTEVSSTDLLLTLNLHPIVRKRFDLVLGMDLGLSNIEVQFDDPAKTLVSSKGRYFAPYINPRFYFGRFGFNIRASLPHLNYQRFMNDAEAAGSSAYEPSYWSGKGIGVSFGMQLRLF